MVSPVSGCSIFISENLRSITSMYGPGALQIGRSNTSCVRMYSRRWKNSSKSASRGA